MSAQRLDIRSRLRRDAQQCAPELSAQEIFASPEFRQYCRSAALSLTGQKTLQVDIICDADSELIGCTDGETVHVNAENALSGIYRSVYARFASVMGILFHELGHVLFLDFDAQRQAEQSIAAGFLWGEMPEPEGKIRQEHLQQMRQALEDPGLRPVLVRIFHEIGNILADAHDEACMKQNFGPFIRECLTMSEEAMRFTSRTLDDLQEAVERGSCPELTAVFALLLQLCRFGTVFVRDAGRFEASPWMTALRGVADAVQKARQEDSLLRRYRFINEIVLGFWPFVQRTLEQCPAGADSNPDIGEVLGQISRGAGLIWKAEAPGGRRSGRHPAGPAVSGEETQQPAEMLPAAETGAAAAALQQVTGKILRQRTRTSEEEASAAETMARLHLPSACSLHRSVAFEPGRIWEVEPGAEALSRQILQEIKPRSRTLQRQIRELYRQRSECLQRRHRLTGKRFEAQDAWRRDRRCFSDRRPASDQPSLAAAVLIDCSGSMSGPRMRAAVRAAILLHDFASGLGIPVLVAGHRTRGERVQYLVAAQFGHTSPRDAACIAQLKARGSNRDGLAIEKTLELLDRRPEQVRLLFVLTDGQPAHMEYSGEAARQDIRQIVSRYAHREVETVALSIGSDREMIREIYGDACVDIDDLETLPAQMVRLLRKRL